MADQGHRIYDALALPEDALSKGGAEILRAGIVDGELYVTVRPAFADPSKWGDVLADTARRLARIYAAQKTGRSEKEILTDIMEAFAADLGAKTVSARPRAAAARRATSKKPAKRSTAKRTSVKRRKR